MRLSPFLIAPILAPILAVVVSSACTRAGKFIEVAVPGATKAKLPVAETLRVVFSAEPASLDWTVVSEATSADVLNNIMDGLISYDLNDKNLRLIPALALKWEPSENGRRWKITLRSDVKWSDGVSFTAQQVLDGWRRLLTRETASNHSYYLYSLKNGRAFSEGKVGFEEVGAKITAPSEISVELERPMSFFPYILTHHATFPVRLDVIKKYGSLWSEPGKIVTLGPFKLKAWEHDRMVALERNDNYYGEKAGIKYVAAYIIGETSTAINLFDSGKLDAVFPVPAIEVKKQRARPQFRSTPGLSMAYYGLNVIKPPMNNVFVRRALSSAIDREEIVRLLNKGDIPMTSFVPVGMFGYEPTVGLSFDPKRARELLKKAGYKTPESFPRFELAFNTNEDNQRVAENIQAQLKRNLGVTVELKNQEWKIYLNNVKLDPPAMYRYGWNADYPDPDDFLGLMAGYSENNHSRWKNTRYDELIIEGSAQLDPIERRKTYARAQKILVEDEIPVIPFYSTVRASLIADRVANFPLNMMWIYNFKGVRLK